MNYSFGVPAVIIESFHILMGGLFAYIGYTKKISKEIYILLMVLGSLAILYHSCLMYRRYFIENFGYGSGMYHGSEFLHTSYIDNSDIKDRLKFKDIKNEDDI